ncbi:MbtH family protein [Embleya sp. NPDC050493]|uniref:MbtH family protein n=1 Tax=Embleya sp. NPDC050493 TaxID=3363989 RepID=UPI0037A71DFE
MTTNDESERHYRVVINDEDQYSVWATDGDIPAGWRPEGFTGTRPACLAHIDEVWTDMRPRSTRESTRL